MNELKCDVCGHLDSEHAPPNRQIQGMWPCEVPGCMCMDIIISNPSSSVTADTTVRVN